MTLGCYVEMMNDFFMPSNYSSQQHYNITTNLSTRLLKNVPTCQRTHNPKAHRKRQGAPMAVRLQNAI